MILSAARISEDSSDVTFVRICSICGFSSAPSEHPVKGTTDRCPKCGDEDHVGQETD